MHLILLALAAPTAWAVLFEQRPLTPGSSFEDDIGICPLARKVTLDYRSSLHPALDFLRDPSFHAVQVSRLSRAVQVPTVVTDFMTDPFHEGFNVFMEFQELLKKMFPLVHSKAHVEHINRLGLLYTLPGQNPALKPLLFMAHQDVVPIDDPSDWTFPPFAGHYSPEDDILWGRGASDCKNVLIALLSVLEDFLSQDTFNPKRTIIFAFGFDEESHGFLGAGTLAPFLERRYGKDAFEFILDEGGMGLQTLGDDSGSNDANNVIYALPGVAERGALDLVLELNVPGGHSSIPPPHTGIGIMAEIVYALEREDMDLFIPVLGHEHPTRRVLECQLRYSPDKVEPWLGKALDSADHVAAALAIARSRGPAAKALLQTSQAVDMFNGGVKVNALPEKISAIVNYRVALHQKPDDVIARAVKIVADIAANHGLSLSHPQQQQLSPPSMASLLSAPFHQSSQPQSKINHISIKPLSEPLDPAPLSPASPESSATWSRFAGVTRSVYESVFRDKTVVVVGDIMTGNTDTRFYWNLSRNIYRWSPAMDGSSLNIHTVDEGIRMDAHLQAMMLYYDLIRSFDIES